VSFTRESVERVKEASDVVEVISAHTDLRRSGARFTGLLLACAPNGDVFAFTAATYVEATVLMSPTLAAKALTGGEWRVRQWCSDTSHITIRHGGSRTKS